MCRYGIKHAWDLLHNSWDCFFFKTILLNRIIFFIYLWKAEYFFVANAVTDYLISSLLNHNIFLGKNHNPLPSPLQVKWSFPYLWLHIYIKHVFVVFQTVAINEYPHIVPFVIVLNDFSLFFPLARRLLGKYQVCHTCI